MTLTVSSLNAYLPRFAADKPTTRISNTPLSPDSLHINGYSPASLARAQGALDAVSMLLSAALTGLHPEIGKQVSFKVSPKISSAGLTSRLEAFDVSAVLPNRTGRVTMGSIPAEFDLPAMEGVNGSEKRPGAHRNLHKSPQDVRPEELRPFISDYPRILAPLLLPSVPSPAVSNAKKRKPKWPPTLRLVGLMVKHPVRVWPWVLGAKRKSGDTERKAA